MLRKEGLNDSYDLSKSSLEVFDYQQAPINQKTLCRMLKRTAVKQIYKNPFFYFVKNNVWQL